MKRTGIPLASSGRNLQPVLESIASGFCMNVAVLSTVEVVRSGMDVGVYKLARIAHEGKYCNQERRISEFNFTLFICCKVLCGLHVGDGMKLKIHPSSVLQRCRQEVVVFNTVQQDDFGWYTMQDVSVVEKGSLVNLLPHLYQESTV